VTLVVWAVLVCSIILMVKNSLRMRYDSPMEAIVGIFELGLENGARILAVEPMVALVVGGLLGGLIAEWARRRWE
ncbi:TrgA family protein, partial [Pseudorhodobacter sp.]|uniref:TrgA family protein n=1 Tax=Pseudorhodobacter sp. TaxID=1934400 RepID=UPI0026477C09